MDSALPPRILLLLTTERAGSTWLFDALRCHPAIYIQPEAKIFEALCMTGRRYPMDLSGSENATLDIEVTPLQWEKIPDFNIERDAKNLEYGYAIEKWHPFFFENDFRAFLKRLTEVEKHSTVCFVYLVRDPSSAIISFLDYQQRNPSWHNLVTNDKLPFYMKQMYDAVLRMALERNGFILDYADLVDDFEGTLSRLFFYLWGGAENSSSKNDKNTELVHIIHEKTARSSREVGETPFLGQNTSSNQERGRVHKDFFSAHTDIINRCYLPYRILLQLKEFQPLQETDKDAFSSCLPLSEELADLCRELTTLDKEIEVAWKQLEQNALRTERNLVKFKKQLTQKNDDVSRIKQQLQEQTQRHNTLVAEKDRTIQQLDDRITNKERQLQDMKSSFSWRLMAPARAIGRFFDSFISVYF